MNIEENSLHAVLISRPSCFADHQIFCSKSYSAKQFSVVNSPFESEGVV